MYLDEIIDQLEDSKYMDSEVLDIVLDSLKKQQPIQKVKEYSTLKEDYFYICTECKCNMEGIHKNYCDNCGKKQY